MRFLILILLVVIGVWLVRRTLRREAQAERDGAVQRPQTADELVRCVQCGVLLPRAEARMASGVLYCSEEHVRLGPSEGKR